MEDLEQLIESIGKGSPSESLSLFREGVKRHDVLRILHGLLDFSKHTEDVRESIQRLENLCYVYYHSGCGHESISEFTVFIGFAGVLRPWLRCIRGGPEYRARFRETRRFVSGMRGLCTQAPLLILSMKDKHQVDEFSERFVKGFFYTWLYGCWSRRNRRTILKALEGSKGILEERTKALLMERVRRKGAPFPPVRQDQNQDLHSK